MAHRADPVGGDADRLAGAGEADIDDACPLFDDNSSETETVTLVDANGNASNSLSVAT